MNNHEVTFCRDCARLGRVSKIPKGSGCGTCNSVFIEALRYFLGLKPIIEWSNQKASTKRPVNQKRVAA